MIQFTSKECQWVGVLRSFSSSLLLCEQIFILAETSWIIAVEGHTRFVFPKLPGRVNWPKAWDSDGEEVLLLQAMALLWIWGSGRRACAACWLLSSFQYHLFSLPHHWLFLHWDTDGPKLFPLCFPKRNNSVFPKILYNSSTSKDSCDICLQIIKTRMK